VIIVYSTSTLVRYSLHKIMMIIIIIVKHIQYSDFTKHSFGLGKSNVWKTSVSICTI